MSRFNDLITEGVSIPLTRLAAGYTPHGLIGKQVWPVCPSILPNGKIPIFNKDAFKIYQTLRARGAHSNRAQLTPDTWLSFSCEEHDIAYPLDQRDLDALKAIPVDSRGKALFNIENRARRKAQWNLALESEQNIATAVQLSTNFSDDHVVTLSGSDQWDATDGGSPIDVFEAAREKIRTKIGVYPNRVAMGATAFQTLKFNPNYTALLRTTDEKIVTAAMIAKFHNFEQINIGLAVTVDADGNFVDLWSDKVVVYYVPSGDFPDLEEPAFGYTIRPQFSPKPYPYIDVFSEEGGKIVNVRNTDMYDDVLIMADAGYLIQDVSAEN